MAKDNQIDYFANNSNSEKNEKCRSEEKCDSWQIIRIVWEGLYKGKTNQKSDNQTTKTF